MKPKLPEHVKTQFVLLQDSSPRGPARLRLFTCRPGCLSSSSDPFSVEKSR